MGLKSIKTDWKTGFCEGTSKADRYKIALLVDAYATDMKMPGADLLKVDYQRCIEICHNQGCPLDLDRMLDACCTGGLPRAGVMHDISGIYQYIDTSTGELMREFWPRYAKVQ